MSKAKLLLTLVILFCPAGHSHAQNGLPGNAKQLRKTPTDFPIVTFAYADLYDSFCSDLTKTKIDPAAVKELQNRLGEFHEAWRKEAPMLLGTVVKLTGAPFDFGETRAALSLCNPGSLSFPLIFDVRKFLRSLHGEKVMPLDQFAATVFHETMHRYVNERKAKLPGGTTPLLEKYKTEPAPVRNHIHLFAIFDEVYRQLGRQKDLDELIAYEKTLNSATVFNRAREIIAAEGTANVICEIGKTRCRRTAKR